MVGFIVFHLVYGIGTLDNHWVVCNPLSLDSLVEGIGMETYIPCPYPLQVVRVVDPCSQWLVEFNSDQLTVYCC